MINKLNKELSRCKRYIHYSHVVFICPFLLIISCHLTVTDNNNLSMTLQALAFDSFGTENFQLTIKKTLFVVYNDR